MRCHYFQNPKARYTRSTLLNSTRSTLLKVDKVDRVGNKVECIRQQSRPRQAVEFTLLLICCQNRQQSWTYRQQSWTYTATVDFVADLLPVSATVDFQQSRPCRIQLCRRCVPGLRLRSRWADVDETWACIFYDLRTQLLGSGILNFRPCVGRVRRPSPGRGADSTIRLAIEST